MNSVIPPATAAKLSEVHPPGTRHKAAMDIAISLIGNGLSPNSVFVQLREKFPPDVTDSELQGIVSFATNAHPTPTTGNNGGGNGKSFHYQPHAPVSKTPERTPVEQVDWWTNGARLSPDEMASKSPVKLPEFPEDCAIAALSTLYQPTDRLNVVTLFTKADEKANPRGGGRTMLRDDWVKFFEDKGVPASDAGAWFRFNPVEAVGTGKDDSYTDDDVTAFRYMLIESDVLPLSVQLAFYNRMRLPVAAVIMSGGKSAHAWIKLESVDGKTYRESVKRILEAIKAFGFDQSNKNPSRLSRLPGAVRKIQAENGGVQRLIWLNPHVPAMTEPDFARFEESLKFPSIDELPMRTIAQRAIPRYEELLANVGKNGVPSGIPELDRVSGGWKKGHTIVIAGQTGQGKTTLALHMIVHALAAGIGVSLFSLEMDADEIFDLMMSYYSKVNRNKFNTGEFTEYDIKSMTGMIPTMSKLPLYIEDSPMLTVDDIRLRVNQLASDKKVGLVVVDYIQFINTQWSRDSRELQVATISHSLRTLARESRIPMVVLSQLNDEGRLRESRVISHNANVVMTVETDDETMKVEIIKGRGIPKGTYAMDFDARFCKLTSKQNQTTQTYQQVVTHPDP